MGLRGARGSGNSVLEIEVCGGFALLVVLVREYHRRWSLGGFGKGGKQC